MPVLPWACWAEWHAAAEVTKKTFWRHLRHDFSGPRHHIFGAAAYHCTDQDLQNGLNQAGPQELIKMRSSFKTARWIEQQTDLCCASAEHCWSAGVIPLEYHVGPRGTNDHKQGLDPATTSSA